VRRLPFLLIVLLAACAPAPAASSGPIASAGADAEGTWLLASGDGPDGELPVLEDHPITLTIAGSELFGRAACNEYGGRIMLEDGQVKIGEMFHTDMACGDPALPPDAVMDAEAAYTSALAAVLEIGTEGEELVMRGPDIELRFTRLPPPPTTDIVDTVWVLETLFMGDIAGEPEGDPATLELRSDGTMIGSTGCRTFTGQWQESGHEIITPIMGMDQTNCRPALSEQDSHVVSVIGDGFVPTVEGDLLTLSDPGGAALVFRREDGP
jgi:heat shock protein HslJ